MNQIHFPKQTESTYSLDEEFLYIKPYLFIKGFATKGDYKFTLKALPLARKIHDGQYRKGTVAVGGKDLKVPYVLHCLKVCSTLMSLNLPLPEKKLDMLYASALLHDTYEDSSGFFPNGGKEFTQVYGFPKEVADTILLLSKRKGATEAELDDYFFKITQNEAAGLIKLADRSHNVEDLYTMTPEKLHKYVVETRQYIYPLATALKHEHPELSNGITILKAKIVSLTEATETIVEIYDAKIEEIKKEYEEKNK